MQNTYTDEQVKDIQERTEKGIAYLKELDLAPAAVLNKVNIGTEGKDIFADLVQPYLADTKYSKKNEVVESEIVSPLSDEMKNA